jgi:hypothetical protein
MTDLATLSMARAGLPTFPGSTVAEQLLNGRDAALAVLRTYVPALAFDPGAAQSVLSQVSVWEERNRDALGQVLGDPSVEALPQALQLALGSDKAQQFVIAVFTQAATGLGPWASGTIGAEVALGTTIQKRWADEDALARLNVFGSIVKMDQDGYLAQLFQPPGQATQGFGMGPLVALAWVVVVGVVALATVLLLQLYAAKKLEANNKLMGDLCKKAQASGDAATVAECIKATENLQQGSIFPGVDELVKGIIKIGLVATLAYVGIKLLLPVLQQRLERGAERSRAS